MYVNIRMAKPEDYEEIEKLMKQIQKVHIDLRPDIFVDIDPVLEKKTFLNHISDRNDYVAEFNDEIVGYVSLAFVKKDYTSIKSRLVLCINTLVVDEKYRGKSIGTQLMDFVKRLRDEMNFDKIELKAWYANKGAVSFYKEIGMKPKTITFEF